MKFILPLFFSATFFFSCSNAENKNERADSIPDSTTISTNAENSPGIISNDSLDAAGIEFGFCDMDGKRMLMLTDSLPDPLLFTKVFSADYKLTDIRYLTKRKATAEDNGRENEFNFKNCKGYLYEVKENAVTRDHSVIFMTPAFISARKIIPLQPPTKKELSPAIKSRIESGKNRKIKDYRCLTSLGKDSAVYLFAFENKGDSALASLAYITTGKIVYEDFPALWNDMSTWRVDDGGNFGVEYFDLLAVFEKNGKLEIVTDWPGAEGKNTEYLREDGGTFKSLKQQGRYTAPD